MGDDLHWFYELEYTAFRYQLASSAEEAEKSLRSWAARVLRNGVMELELKELAAKVLASKHLKLIPICGSRLF